MRRFKASVAVEEMLLRGVAIRDIVRYVSEKFALHSKSVERLIDEVYAGWEEARRRWREHDLAVAVQRREALYGWAVRDGDRSLALRVLDSLDRVKGVLSDGRAVAVGAGLPVEEAKAADLLAKAVGRLKEMGLLKDLVPAAPASEAPVSAEEEGRGGERWPDYLDTAEDAGDAGRDGGGGASA